MLVAGGTYANAYADDWKSDKWDKGGWNDKWDYGADEDWADYGGWNDHWGKEWDHSPMHDEMGKMHDGYDKAKYGGQND